MYLVTNQMYSLETGSEVKYLAYIGQVIGE